LACEPVVWLGWRVFPAAGLPPLTAHARQRPESVMAETHKSRGLRA
jgi:hypothetical protein